MQKILTYDIVNLLVHEPSVISLEEDFVAIAVNVSKKGEASHCGLVVNYNKEPKLFHFEFTDGVKSETLDGTYFLNILPLIKKEEVLTFLAKCEMICDNEPDLEFGFFYSGEFFDENNKIIFNLKDNNITNCVYFCISVIAGFILSEQYVEFDDWKGDIMAENWFKNVFLRTRRKEKLTQEQLKAFSEIVKRIPPIDYFSSAEITSLPIRKEDVDQYSGFMAEVLLDRFKSKIKNTQ